MELTLEFGDVTLISLNSKRKGGGRFQSSSANFRKSINLHIKKSTPECMVVDNLSSSALLKRSTSFERYKFENFPSMGKHFNQTLIT